MLAGITDGVMDDVTYMQRQKKAKEHKLKLYMCTMTYFVYMICKIME